MARFSRIRVVPAMLGSALLIALPVWAGDHSFSGMARDGIGNVLEGVRIFVLPERFGAARVAEVRTSPNGRFEIAHLAPGTYRIAAVKEGYLTFLGRVNTGYRPTFDITLESAVYPADGKPSTPRDASWTLRLPKRSILRDVDRSTWLGPGDGEPTGGTGGARASAFAIDHALQGEVSLCAVAGRSSGDARSDPRATGSETRMSLRVPIHEGARMRLGGHRDRISADSGQIDSSRQDDGFEWGLSYDLSLDSNLDVNAYYSRGGLDLPVSVAGGATIPSRQEQRTWGYDANWSKQLDDRSRVNVRMDFRDTALELPISTADEVADGTSDLSNRAMAAATSYESVAGAGHRVQVGVRARMVDLPARAVGSPSYGALGTDWGEGQWSLGVDAQDAWSISGAWTLVYGLSFQDNFDSYDSALVVPRLGAAWSVPAVRIQATVAYHTSADDPGHLPAAVDRIDAARSLGYEVSAEGSLPLGVRLKAARLYEPVQYGYGFGASEPVGRPIYLTDGNASTTRDSVVVERRFGATQAWARISRGTAEGRLARIPAIDVPVLLLADRTLRFSTGQIGVRLDSSGTEILGTYHLVEESVPYAQEPSGSTHDVVEIRVVQDLLWLHAGSTTWRVLLAARTASTGGHDAAEHSESLDSLTRQVRAGVSVTF